MMVEKPTILLIPGAWHRSSCYDTLIDLLQEAGFPTIKIDHQSLIDGPSSQRVSSHHEDAENVRVKVQTLIADGKDIVAFCHSYGGIPTTEGLASLGKRPGRNGITNIIYCSAFVVCEGQSLGYIFTVPELASGLPQDWHSPGPVTGTRIISPDRVLDLFYADVDPNLARKTIEEDVTAQDEAVLSSAVTKCAWREIPATYIVCEDDRVLSPEAQRWMAKQADIETLISLKSSHSPFLSMPKEVATLIQKIATGTHSSTAQRAGSLHDLT